MFTPLILLLTVAAGTGSPPRAKVPPDVSAAGLFELTRQGEVMLLPRHDEQPFNALLLTRATTSCESVRRTMLDVEGYTKRFNVTEVRVLERTPTTVRYELELGVAFAP